MRAEEKAVTVNGLLSSPMRIFSLNIYMARAYEPLIKTIREYADRTDVFCLQEVPHVFDPKTNRETYDHPQLFSELSEMLPRFAGFLTFSEMIRPTETAEAACLRQKGLALFVKRAINVESVEPLSSFTEVYGPNSKGQAIVHIVSQHARLNVDGAHCSLFNVHAAAFPGDKLDTPERLAQTDALIQAAQGVNEHSIILGDFNLLPEAESVKAFARAGFVNLIEREQIKSTRGTLCKQLHPEFSRPPYTVQEYADYTFVSPTIDVRSFEVPDLPISDHLPMIMDVEIRASKPVLVQTQNPGAHRKNS